MLQVVELGLALLDRDLGEIDLALKLAVDQIDDDLAGADGVAWLDPGPFDMTVGLCRHSLDRRGDDRGLDLHAEEVRVGEQRRITKYEEPEDAVDAGHDQRLDRPATYRQLLQRVDVGRQRGRRDRHVDALDGVLDVHHRAAHELVEEVASSSSRSRSPICLKRTAKLDVAGSTRTISAVTSKVTSKPWKGSVSWSGVSGASAGSVPGNPSSAQAAKAPVGRFDAMPGKSDEQRRGDTVMPPLVRPLPFHLDRHRNRYPTHYTTMRQWPDGPPHMRFSHGAVNYWLNRHRPRATSRLAGQTLLRPAAGSCLGSGYPADPGPA